MQLLAQRQAQAYVKNHLSAQVQECFVFLVLVLMKYVCFSLVVSHVYAMLILVLGLATQVKTKLSFIDLTYFISSSKDKTWHVRCNSMKRSVQQCCAQSYIPSKVKRLKNHCMSWHVTQQRKHEAIEQCHLLQGCSDWLSRLQDHMAKNILVPRFDPKSGDETGLKNDLSVFPTIPLTSCPTTLFWMTKASIL